jgi:hypothetical protein
MTTTLRHHSPLGAITIVGAFGLIEPDTDFELPDHLAARLLEQEDIFELVSGDPRDRDEQTVRQLRHELAERGLPYDGKKDELLERIRESDRTAAAPLIAAPEPVPAVELPADLDGSGEQLPAAIEGDTSEHTHEPANEPAPEPVDEPVDVVTDEPTTTEPATGQEGA